MEKYLLIICYIPILIMGAIAAFYMLKLVFNIILAVFTVSINLISFFLLKAKT